MNRHGGRGGPMRNNGGGKGGRGFYGPPGGRQSGGQNVNRGMPVPRAANAVPPPSQRVQPYPQAKPGKGGGNANHPRQPQQGGKPQNAPHPHMDHLFSTKVRHLIDTRLRAPHRRTHLGALLRTVAHWTSYPALTTPVLNQHVPVTLKTDPEECIITADVNDEEVPAPVLDARVLLCTGCKQGDRASTMKQPVLKRISTVYKKAADGYTMYGGVTAATSHQDIVASLVSKVKEQCGLDLGPVTTWYKFLELNYANGVPTVVYLPAVWELTDEVVLSGTVKEVTTERTELVEQELSREGMTDEEYQEAKSELKPEEKIITEVTRETDSTPVTLSLADLLTTEVKKGSTKEVVEAHMAADAFDEFLKREMATKINRKLVEKEKEAAEAAEAKAAEEKEREEKKRKREEEEKEEREKKQVQIEELKAKWELEDQGKTDDEKRDALIERKAIMAELTGADQDADKDTKDNRKYRTLLDVDQSCIEAFEYFDRPSNNPTTRPSGHISRPRLENILLCIDGDACMSDLDARLNAAGKGNMIAYRLVCTKERKELIPESEIVDVPEATPIKEEEMNTDIPMVADELPIAEEVLPDEDDAME